ncbi:MAG: hypothetical protein GX685_04125 [Clostridiales bacterium]|nr:hypothetical protein [Clostridiales bacterium]
MKRKKTGYFILVLSIMFCAGAIPILAGSAYADENTSPQVGSTFSVSTVTLSSGSHYDISQYGINTQLLIDKPGDYYLNGESSHVFVTVDCGGVDLHLENGLKIDASAVTNVGRSAPAIDVRDNGGEVKISSCAGANCTLWGYMSGSIRKNGTNTKLVLATDDTSRSGSVNVMGAKWNNDAAIGSQENKSTGNMVFES